MTSQMLTPSHQSTPIRETTLPYGRQWVDEDDIAAVVDVLRSDWLTTGPQVAEFERAVADFVGVRAAVAVNSGTAALHAAIYALGIGPGDEAIVTPMSFAASANCVVYQGGKPVFADVAADTLLLDPATIEARITPRTRAIIAVDYAGQPCDYDALRTIANRHGLALVADACHAIGGRDQVGRVGALADLSTFSFHPVKHITTGEGGMITTNDADRAAKLRTFRNHGITTDHRQRAAQGSWHYEMVDLGYNYRITDFQCALGLNQLRKLPAWVARRQAIAQQYDAAFAALPAVEPLATRPGVYHAYHLYVIQLALEELNADHSTIFAALRGAGIGVNVHYIPIHLHPYYRTRFGTQPGDCPVAEAAYARIISLPIFPRMSEQDVADVIVAVTNVMEAYTR